MKLFGEQRGLMGGNRKWGVWGVWGYTQSMLYMHENAVVLTKLFLFQIINKKFGVGSLYRPTRNKTMQGTG